MLSQKGYIQKFNLIQEKIIEVTDTLTPLIQPGMNEKEIADRYIELLAQMGLYDHWYPILVCAGSNTGKPLSRRIHLPSRNAIVKTKDIVILDCTPIDGTAWGNWSKTIVIGNDAFYKKLSDDCDKIAEETFRYGQKSAKTIGDIFDYCINLIQKLDMVLLDSRNDVGHSIFQVPVGQKVENTPIKDRLFISEEYRKTKLKGIISIEPQVGRINPGDGVMYGAKQQKIIIKNSL